MGDADSDAWRRRHRYPPMPPPPPHLGRGAVRQLGTWAPALDLGQATVKGPSPLLLVHIVEAVACSRELLQCGQNQAALDSAEPP